MTFQEEQAKLAELVDLTGQGRPSGVMTDKGEALEFGADDPFPGRAVGKARTLPKAKVGDLHKQSRVDREREEWQRELEPLRDARKLTASDALEGKGASDFVPFVSGAKEAMEMGTLWRAGRRYELGTHTKEDYDLMLDYARKAAEVARRGTTLGYKVAGILADSLPFAGEFILTGGAGALGRKALGKAAKETAEKTVLGKFGGVLARGAIQTGVSEGVPRLFGGEGRVSASTYARALPDMGLGETDAGEFLIFAEGSSDGFMEALPRGLADQLIENLSEHAGALIPSIRVLQGKVAGKWIKETGKTYRDFMARISRYGWNGPINEYIEERIGGALRATGAGVGLRESKEPDAMFNALIPDIDDAVAELTAFGLMGGVVGGTGIALSKLTKGPSTGAPSPGESSSAPETAPSPPEPGVDEPAKPDPKEEGPVVPPGGDVLPDDAPHAEDPSPAGVETPEPLAQDSPHEEVPLRESEAGEGEQLSGVSPEVGQGVGSPEAGEAGALGGEGGLSGGAEGQVDQDPDVPSEGEAVSGRDAQAADRGGPSSSELGALSRQNGKPVRQSKGKDARLERFAKGSGVTYHAVESEDGNPLAFDGVFLRDGHVAVDVNAKQPQLAVLGHEISHNASSVLGVPLSEFGERARKADEEGRYQARLKYRRQFIGAHVSMGKTRVEAVREYRKMSPEERKEEFTATHAQELIYQIEHWRTEEGEASFERVLQNDPGLVRSILNAIRDFLKRRGVNLKSSTRKAMERLEQTLAKRGAPRQHVGKESIAAAKVFREAFDAAREASLSGQESKEDLGGEGSVSREPLTWDQTEAVKEMRRRKEPATLGQQVARLGGIDLRGLPSKNEAADFWERLQRKEQGVAGYPAGMLKGPKSKAKRSGYTPEMMVQIVQQEGGWRIENTDELLEHLEAELSGNPMLHPDIEADVLRELAEDTPAGIQYEPGEAVEGFFSPSGDIKSPAFKRWFGGSKVVDERGEPLVVYHGTEGAFTEFDPGRDNTTSKVPAHYFSEKATTADTFGGHSFGARIPVYLVLRNPLQVKRVTPTLVEKAHRMGHDGLIGENTVFIPSSGREYVVFSPTQIKSATGNRGTFDAKNPDIRFSPSGESPPFFSALEKAIETHPHLPKAPLSAETLDNIIRKTKGVTEEELKWVNWSELFEGRKKVSKQEALDWVRANQVEVREKVLGDADVHALRTKARRARKDFESLHFLPEQGPGRALFNAPISEYTPERIAARRAKHAERVRVARVAMLEAESLLEGAEEEGPTQYPQSSLQLPGGEEYRELLLTLPSTGKDFAAPHFDEPNLLAHIRMTTRTGTWPGGSGRILFGEEWQSDWATEAHKKGVASSPLDAGLHIETSVGRNAYGGGEFEIVRVMNRDGDLVLQTTGDHDAALRDARRRISDGVADFRVPDAPFIRGKWKTLALKRIIKWAADNGYDAVGWTTGKQQVERNEAANRQVTDSHSWEERYKAFVEPQGWVKDVTLSKDGRVVVTFVVDGDGVIESGHGGGGGYAGEKLESVIGKGSAAVILESDSGEGGELIVGGKGYQDVYDREGVKTANMLAKRFGGKVVRGSESAPTYQVKSVPTTPTGAEWYVMGSDGTSTGPFKYEAQAEEAHRELIARPTQPIHVLPLTPEMSSHVKEKGFSTFAPRFSPAPEENTVGWRRMVEKMAPELKNEDGSPKVLYHGTGADFTEFRLSGGGELGRGIYLADDPGTADMLGSRGGGGGGSIMPVYFTASNPLVTEDREDVRGSSIAAKQRAGYDGIIFTETTGRRQYVAFDPSQVKSATGNTGAYDPENPDIRYSPGNVSEIDPARREESEAKLNDYHKAYDLDTTEADLRSARHESEIMEALKVDGKLPGYLRTTARARIYKRAVAQLFFYIDLKGQAKEEYRKFREYLTPGQKKLYRESQDLSPGLKRVAEEIILENQAIGGRAKDAGVIQNVYEFYTARIWKEEEGGFPANRLPKFSKTAGGRAKQRTLSSVLQGLAAGKTLAVPDAVYAQNLASKAVTQAEHDRALVEELKAVGSLKRASKLEPSERGNWKQVNHPNFTDTVFAGTVEEGELYGSAFFQPDDTNTVLEKIPLLAPRDLAQKLNNILGESALYDIRGFTLATKLNALAKSTILFTSFFHHQAFLRSFLFSIPFSSKTLKYHVPILGQRQAYKEGAATIKEFGPEVKELVAAGLTLGKSQDFDPRVLAEWDTFDEISDKIGASGKFKEFVQAFWHRQSNFLFNHLGPNLKVMAALLEYQHLVHKNRRALEQGTESKERLAAVAADLANDDFGGLNLRRKARNPTLQHGFRLTALAPDWTESNVNTLWKAFRKGKEGNVYRMLWVRAFAKAAVITAVWNILMAGGDDEEFIKHLKMSWREGFKERKGASYGSRVAKGLIKALSANMDPVAFGATPGSHKWFSVLGHFQDPIKWLAEPGRSAKHKSSVLVGTALDAILGADWKGMRFTTFEELLGIDDKGLYKRRSGEDRKGDPKGGKLKGQTVAWKWASGPIGYREVPSFILNQAKGFTPIQFQAWMGYLAGEHDLFDTIARTVGAKTSSSYPKAEEE